VTVDASSTGSYNASAMQNSADSALSALFGGAAGSTSAAQGATGAASSSDSATSAAVRAAALLPQLLSASPMADTASVSHSISTPVSDSGWPQALAAQVQWMAGNQIKSATLSLSPAHLGPIQVRIDLQQSQINVSFSAAHADTRSALADAIPKLREMLASGGLSLGEASVQQEAPGGSQARSQSSSADGSDAKSSETVEAVAVASVRSLGLVDEYA
jgi:flagellar hook-length control protein FliK